MATPYKYKCPLLNEKEEDAEVIWGGRGAAISP